MSPTNVVLLGRFSMVSFGRSFCSAPVHGLKRRRIIGTLPITRCLSSSSLTTKKTANLRGIPNKNLYLHSFDEERAKQRFTWDESFQLLKDYKEDFKTTRVKMGDDKTLADWVFFQRCNKHSLSQEKIALLNSIGFEWEKGRERKERRWKEQYEKLLSYKTEHGDCLVPTNYTADPALGRWVQTQRTYKKRKQLQPEREKKLEQIGFVWWRLHTCSQPDKPYLELLWERQYNKTVAFKETHGHCMIPHFYAEDTQLAVWVATQRSEYKRGNMRPDRVRKLNEIGFVWKRVFCDDEKSLWSLRWDTMFKHLLDYKAETGHTNVPRAYDKFGLGKWASQQRALRTKLAPSRKKLLTEIGFRWNPRAPVWNERFNQLRVLFQEQDNSCLPPDMDPTLRNWVYAQRYQLKKDKLSSEQTAMLESIGFPWGKALVQRENQ